MTEPAVLEQLREYALGLDSVAPGPGSEFDWLGERLATAEVIGLGEATHGTREFVQFKHRLLQHLVTETGLRALCLEAGFAETLAVDRYVTDGEASAREALESLRGWSWAVEEVAALLAWLREFNADRPRAERVRVYGLDAQYTTAAVDELAGFLRMVDLDCYESVRDDLDHIDDDGSLLGRGPDHTRRVEAADRLLAKLRERFATDRDRWTAATSRESYRLARRCLDHIEHAVSFKQAVRALRADSNGEEARARCLRRRDEAMAATVAWVRETHPRVAVWAHDAHVNRNGQRARDGSAPAPSLGSLLADRHGDDYLAVGFAFGQGQFRAITEIVDPEEPKHVRRLQRHTRSDPGSGTIEEVLAALDLPVVAVDLRRARGDDRLAGVVDEPREHFSVGTTYDGDAAEAASREFVYGEAFDVLCYVDETTPTRPLE